MGSRSLPLLLLAALVAGGGFWWLSTRDSGRTGARVSTGTSAPAAPGETAALEDPATPPETLDAVQPTRVEVKPQPPEEKAAGAELGEGLRVRGRVSDRFGNPVPGARVVAAAGEGFQIDIDSAGDLPWLERRRAVADEKGVFELSGVEPGRLRIAVKSHGFAPYQREGIRVPAIDGVFELEPIALEVGAILSGRVVDGAGHGVAGAKLIPVEVDGSRQPFFFGARREPTAESGAGGVFRIDELACGPWRFLVRHEEHPDLFVEGSADRPGEEVGGLVWQVEPGDTISGRVTDVPADERGVLEVRAARNSGLDFELFTGGRSASVDAAGNFTVRGLEVGGEYELQARHGRQRDSFWERTRSQPLRARAGQTGVVLVYQPEAALVFQVVDAVTRQPLTKFEVEAGIGWTEPVRDGGRTREVHPEGRVRVGGLRPTSSDDRVLLAIHATGYREFQQTDIALASGQELDLGQILLDPVPVVRVRVLDGGSGEPVAGAQVRLEKAMESGNFSVKRSVSIDAEEGSETIEIGDSRSARTDEQGIAELTSFEGETCALEVRTKTHAPYELTDLFLPEGETIEREVRLTPGGAVQVTVLDAAGTPAAGMHVRHRAPESSGGERLVVLDSGSDPDSVTDSDGKVLFKNLESGRHGFSIGDGGDGPMIVGEHAFVIPGMGGDDDAGWTEVQVVEGETAELTLQAEPEGSLTGRVREAGAWLAGATLRLEPKRPPGAGQRMMIPSFGGGGGDRARSDGEGRYRIDGVKRGKYVLSVEHPTRRMAQEFEVDLREGENTFDVELALSVIEGRITDQEDEPLAGVRVWAERLPVPGENGRTDFHMVMIVSDGDGAVMKDGSLGGDSAYTDEDGRYALRGVAPDVDLVVKAEGEMVQPGSSERLRVGADEVRRGVDLELEAGGAIEVEALLSDGAPARMCMVRATYADATAGIEPKFSFIESGSTTIKGLKPGLWNVNVQRAGPGRDGDRGIDREIEVEASETANASFELD